MHRLPLFLLSLSPENTVATQLDEVDAERRAAAFCSCTSKRVESRNVQRRGGQDDDGYFSKPEIVKRIASNLNPLRITTEPSFFFFFLFPRDANTLSTGPFPSINRALHVWKQDGNVGGVRRGNRISSYPK